MNSDAAELVSAVHGNLQGKELRTFIKLSGLNPPCSTLSLFPENTLRVTRSSAIAAKLVDSGSSSNEEDADVHRHGGIVLSSRDNVRQEDGKAALNGSVRSISSLADSYRSLQPSSGVNCKSGDPAMSVHMMGSPVVRGLKEDSSHILRNRTAQSLRRRPYNINQRGSASNYMSS